MYGTGCGLVNLRKDRRGNNGNAALPFVVLVHSFKPDDGRKLTNRPHIGSSLYCNHRLATSTHISRDVPPFN